MPKIILTGGGSAGHVTPNIALLSSLKKNDFQIHYIGTSDGIEKNLLSNEDVLYHSIPAGKLRRYFDFKNFTDIGKIAGGFLKSFSLIKKIKPDIIFSKGGFVTVPVVWAANLLKIPIIIHESDITPGLANRLSSKFATKICYSFPESLNHIQNDKVEYTGLPIRENVLYGDSIAGLQYCGFNSEKPVLLVIGGSLGSAFLNNIIRECLQDLLKDFQICHICGKGNTDSSLSKRVGYVQFEYIYEELSSVFAASDIVLSRAGATAIFELLALKKPNILIPLSKAASRGDQILNAKSFKKQGFSIVIEEASLTPHLLIEKIQLLNRDKYRYIDCMNNCKSKNSVDQVVDLILKSI